MDRYRFARVTVEEYFGYDPKTKLKYIEDCGKDLDEIKVYLISSLSRSVIIREAINHAAAESNAKMRHMGSKWNYEIQYVRDDKKLALLSQEQFSQERKYCMLSIPMSKQPRVRIHQRKFLESVTKHLEELLVFP